MEKPLRFLRNRNSTSFIFIIAVFLGLFFPAGINAQGETFEGEVTNIYKEENVKFDFSDNEQLYQELEVRFTNGSLDGEKATIKNGNYPMTNVVKYEIGDRVIVDKIENLDGTEEFIITDYIRRKPLFILGLIFVFLAVVVGRIRGAFSILGMIVSFFVIFAFIMPRIYAGDDPVSTVILGSLVIIPATFYLSHGFNKKTTVAVFGTLIALLLTGLLADFFVEAAKLTGYSSDEASFIQSLVEGKTFDVRGLLLAGIIIGVLGVLDDVTVSQSAIVFQLKSVNNKLKNTELFRRAMSVGQDHISSMVNTLVLVYTGASLPLLILFLDSSRSFAEVINYEIIADEIVRTLVGSIGLILAVPITTFLAVVFSGEKVKREVRKI